MSFLGGLVSDKSLLLLKQTQHFTLDTIPKFMATKKHRQVEFYTRLTCLYYLQFEHVKKERKIKGKNI